MLDALLSVYAWCFAWCLHLLTLCMLGWCSIVSLCTGTEASRLHVTSLGLPSSGYENHARSLTPCFASEYILLTPGMLPSANTGIRTPCKWHILHWAGNCPWWQCPWYVCMRSYQALSFSCMRLIQHTGILSCHRCVIKQAYRLDLPRCLCDSLSLKLLRDMSWVTLQW